MVEPVDPHPVRRFAARAADYARFRPGYPADAMAAIVADLGDPAALRAVDVAAGTGISARALADRGPRVIAIEPSPAMRDAAAPHPRVTWRCGTAEATGLATGAADVLLVAQAFHWFDQPAALREFQRVLRPGGRLAILWNRRSRRDPFTLAYREALQAIDAEPPAERSHFDPAVVAATGLYDNIRSRVFAHAQRHDLPGLIGRAESTSTVPQAGPQHAELLRRLRLLHDRFADADGEVAMHYDVQLVLAESRTTGLSG